MEGIKVLLGRKGVQLTLHLAGVALFLLSPYLLAPPGRSGLDADFSLRFLAGNVLVLAFFYLNLLVLLPRFLPRGWPYYFGSLLVVLVFLGALRYFTARTLFPRDEPRPRREGEMLLSREGRQLPPPDFMAIERSNWRLAFMSLFPFLMAWGLSTSIRFSLNYAQTEQEKKERETETLKSELALLRYQISPHFMFNLLNSLTALARKKSDDLEPIIIKLSQFMRYSIYDSNVARVPIAREEEYLQNYIDLQTLRVGKDVQIIYRKEITDAHFEIEPMMLIPFVENAFKHGVGLVPDPMISINLTCRDNQLTFRVKNKISPSDNVKDHTHGIGLQNIRRRLELLYKNNYTLSVTRAEDWFFVELNLVAE